LEQVVIDTSVGLKWIFLHEEGAYQAAHLLLDHLRGRWRLVVPALFYYEAANALRHSTNRLTLQQAEAALTHLRGLKLVTHPTSSGLMRCALEISYQYEVSLYDAVFVATALRRGARLVTADKKAHSKMSGLSFVELLKGTTRIVF